MKTHILDGIRHNISIRTQFFLTVMLSMLLFSLLFSAINYRITLLNSEKQVRYSSEKLVALACSYLDTIVTNEYHVVDTIGLNPSVQEIFSNPPSVYSNNAAVWLRDVERINDINASMYSNFTVTRYRYISSNGICNNDVGIGSDNPENQFLYSGIFEDLDWYRAFKQTRSPYLWLAPDTVPWEGNHNLMLLRKVQDPDDLRNFFGMVAVEVSPALFNDLLDEACAAEDMSLFVLDRENRLVASSSGAAEDIKPVTAAMAQPEVKPNTGTIVKLEHESIMAVYAPMHNVEWRVYAVAPYQRSVWELAMASLKSNLLIIACLSPIMLLFSFFAASFTARPIKDLTKSMLNSKTQPPQTAQVLPGHGKNEIALLTRSYNYMLVQFMMAMDQQYELGREMQALELRSLRAQINPHFLYNTLDMVHWMAYSAHMDDIDRVIQSMAEFYKLSLRSGEDMSTVRQELHHIDAYLAIQNMRFNNGITLKTEIPESFMENTLPTITLQPLVENAVQHGIMETADERGTIEITARMDGTDVLISIHDDGVGIPPEKLSKLLHHNTCGYGIENVNKRMQLLFGSEYGLEFHSVPGEGTTVIVRFPANCAGNIHTEEPNC